MEPRFSPGMISGLKLLISEFIKKNADANYFLSLAAGADILFAEEVVKQNCSLTLVFPCSSADFIRISITPFDPDGQYLQAFHKLILKANKVTELAWNGTDLPDFEACNYEIVKQASHNSSQISACLFLNPTSSHVKGGSQDFSKLLKEKGIGYENLYAQILKTEPSNLDFHDLVHQVREMDQNDHIAIQSQKTWKNKVRFSLILFASVGILSALDGVSESSMMGHGKLIKTVALAAALLAAILEFFLNPRKGKNRSLWISARAKSEKIKSQFWLYLLTERQPIENKQFQSFQPLVLTKSRLCLCTFEEKRQLYRKWRIEDQARYFTSKCERLSSQLKLSTWLQRVLLLGGITFGVLRLWVGFQPDASLSWLDEINFLACFATVAIILSAYQESINTEDQLFQYSQMIERMAEIDQLLELCQNETDFQNLVQNCEDVLSAQNNEWSIRLG